MKFWNDELRICTRCKTKIKMAGEERAKCPNCQSDVWFFNYAPIPTPPDLPEPESTDLWKNQTTSALLIATGLLALVALVGIYNGILVAAACSLAAIGFAIFGFIRHAETRRIEQSLEHMTAVTNYARSTRNRARENASRYTSLLRTGNTQIEHYYDEIYAQAC